MAKRNLEFRLGDNVNTFIHAYEVYLERKRKEFLERVANRLKQLIEANFAGTIVDDRTEDSGGPQPASVSVADPVADGDGYMIVVNGKDAVWVEFGAGVHHNGAMGTSPNPYGTKLKFSIGGYSKMFPGWDKWPIRGGKHAPWSYGTPAQMPMYRAVQTLIAEIPQIAQEVFA